jgi:plasmid stabilization system protein ParE
MKLRLTPRAFADAQRMKTWWQRHRGRAPDLFEQELNAALDSIVAAPSFGRLYGPAQTPGEVRRVLLRKTRNYVYYTVIADEVLVLTVWGARKARPPKL